MKSEFALILYIILMIVILSIVFYPLIGCSITRPDYIDQQMYKCMDKPNTITTVYMSLSNPIVKCEATL